MIDLTKPLSRPIRKDFLENVLNGVDKDNNDPDTFSDEQINKLLRELDDNVGNITPVDMMDDLVGGRDPGTTVDREWWIEKDAKGNPLTPDYEEGDPIVKILKSPYFLVKYVIKSIEHNKQNTRNDFIPLLDSVFKCFGVLGVAALIMVVYKLNFIVNPTQLAVVSIALSLGSKVAQQIIVNKEEYNEISDEVKDIQNNDEFIKGAFSEDDTEDYMEDIEFFDDEEYFSEDYYEEPDYDDMNLDNTSEDHQMSMKKKIYSDNLELDQHIIKGKLSEDEFNNKILDVFLSNEQNRKQRLTTRRDIVLSMNKYVLCNNPGFSDLKAIPAGHIVYNNISYLIYEGIRSIYPQLNYTGEYIMDVRSVTENQLYYKLEVALPKIIKRATVVKSLDVIESKFREHEADNEVDVNITYYGDTFVFRVKKGSSTIVTWGDAIRYYDPLTNNKTYESFMDDSKYTLPVLIGLQNDEAPVMFDIAKNTSIAIAGTSGSGKSWAVYSLLYNIMVQSHPGDASFIILDFKGDPQYMEFARMPHVVGYHGNIDNYNDYIKEVVLELNRRKEMTKKLGISQWHNIREKFQNDPDKLHKFPWLFVVVEETAAVLSSLESSGKKTELRDEFIRNLKEIAKQGRSLGMRLIMISQRTTSNELPRDIVSECGVKLAFKLSERDLELVEMMPVGIVPPKRLGTAVFKEEYLTSPIVLKSLGIGGMNDNQIKSLTRMMAFDWNLRVKDSELEGLFPTFKITDNRKVRREEVFNDLKEERYFVDADDIDIEAVLASIDGTDPPKQQDPWGKPAKQQDPWEKPKPEPKPEPKAEPKAEPKELFFNMEEFEGYLYEDEEETTEEHYEDQVESTVSIEEEKAREDMLEEYNMDLIDLGAVIESPQEIEVVTKEEIENKSETKPETKPKIRGMMGAYGYPHKSSKPKNSYKEDIVETSTSEPTISEPTIPEPTTPTISEDYTKHADLKKYKKARSVVEFIILNGEKNSLSGASRIDHDTLVRFFTKEEILDAVNNVEIVQRDEYYIT